jgi:hypothetical protein
METGSMLLEKSLVMTGGYRRTVFGKARHPLAFVVRFRKYYRDG